MKKIIKPAGKKTAPKKPAAKKSSTKPKRKAQSQAKFAQLLDRLETIVDQLALTALRKPRSGMSR